MCAIESANFDYRQSGMTQEQWNSLPKEVQEQCKSDPIFATIVKNRLSEGAKPEDLSTKLANKGTDKPAQAVGTEIQKTNQSELDKLKPKVLLEDMEDKNMRKANEAQWKDYFEARYKANPAEARYDIAKIMHRKEVAQVQAGLQNMLDDTKQSKVIKAKYLAEGFASEKEKKAYADKMIELQAYYKNNKAEAIRDYNGLFRVQGYNDPVDEGGHLNAEQFDALIRLKGLDSLEVDGDRLEYMAVTAVVQSRFNKGIQKANEYMAQIEQLKTEGMTPEARKIQQQAIELDSQYGRQSAKLMQEAETEESKKLFKELAARNKETEAEIAKQKRLGNDAKAAELQAQMMKDRAESQVKIHAAMNQDKLKEAGEIETKRHDARIAAEKDVYAALDPKVKDKIKKLEVKAQEAVKEANGDSNKEILKKIPDIAAIMAEAQVDKQRAEARVNRTTVNWNDGKEQDDGKTRNTYLDDEMRAFVQENPELFCEKVDADSPEANFKGTIKGPDGKPVTVGYKFDSKLFKDYMVRVANDYQLDNEDANDPSHKADYYATIKERKELNDAKNYGYALPAKLKDRRFAGKCFKVVGIDVEKDKTVAKRIGNLAKTTIVGAGVGAAVATLSEYISTTKVVESPFFKVVEYSGSVPYVQMIKVKGTAKTQFQKTVHVEGDQAYHQQIEVSGVATGDVTLGYSGSGTAHYTGSQDYTYSGGGTVNGVVSGVATGDVNGTATGKVPVSHTHTDYQNGIPVGSQTWTEDVDVSLPYSDKVSIPYEKEFSKDYTYSGKGTVNYEGDVGYEYSGTTTGKGEIPYKKVVDADGTVHWEADVNIDEEVAIDYEQDVEVKGEQKYSGKEEVSGTTTGRPKMNWGVVKKATIVGAIGGFGKGLMDWNKIYDEGGREEGIARNVLAKKGVDQKPVTPITPPPAGDDDDDITTPPPVTPPPVVDTKKDEFEACVTPEDGENIEPISFNIGAKKTGKMTKDKNGNDVVEYEAHLWQSIYNAFDIKKADQTAFRKAFVKEILGGKAFFTGKEQSIKPSFTLNDPKFKDVVFKFNKEAFDNTPKEKYYMAAGVTSGNVNDKAQKGDPTWSGTATCTLANGTVKQFVTNKKHTSQTDAENDLKAQINADTTLTPQQKAEALKSVEEGCKQD